MLDAVNSSDQLLAAEDIFKAVTTPVVDDYTTDARSRTSEQVKNEHIKGIFEKLLPNKSDVFSTDELQAGKTTTPVAEVLYETYGETFEELNSSKTYKEDAVPHIDPEMYDYEAHSKEVETHTIRSTIGKNVSNEQSEISNASVFTTSYATSVSPTPSEVVEKTTRAEIARDQLLATVVTEMYNKLETEKHVYPETTPKFATTSVEYLKTDEEEVKEHRYTTANYNRFKMFSGLLKNEYEDNPKIATEENSLLSEVNRYDKQNVVERFQDVLIKTGKMLDVKAELEAPIKTLQNTLLSSTEFDTLTSIPTTTSTEYLETDKGSRDNYNSSTKTEDLLNNRREQQEILSSSDNSTLRYPNNKVNGSNSTSIMDVNTHGKENLAQDQTKVELATTYVKNPSTLTSVFKIITPNGDIFTNSSLTKQNEESSTLTNASSTAFTDSNAKEYSATTVRYDSSNGHYEKLITEASFAEKTSRHIRGPSTPSIVSGESLERIKTFEAVTKSILTVEDNKTRKGLQSIQSHQAFNHVLSKKVIDSTQNAAYSSTANNNERLGRFIHHRPLICCNISFTATVFRDVSNT